MSDFEQSVNKFISGLKNFQELDLVFNPWTKSDGQYDIGEEAPKIRCENLRKYLLMRENANYILIAEAPGYQGCHFSGIPMTSERLFKNHKDIFKGMKRSSNPQKSMGQPKTVQKDGFAEPTATIVWELMVNELCIEPDNFVLWNTFAFHPHEKSNLLSNRTPCHHELKLGRKVLDEFLKLFPTQNTRKIIAVGNVAKATTVNFGYAIEEECCVRHPAYGGAKEFCSKMRQLLEK